MSYSYNRSKEAVSVEDPTDENIGEVAVAEYAVFLWSLDAYIRYLEESRGGEATDLSTLGIRLLKSMETRVAESVRGFLAGKYASNKSCLTFITAAFGRPITDADDVARRAYKVRAVFVKGGAEGVRHTFGSSREAYAKVMGGITGTREDDPDTVLAKLAKIPMKNGRLEAWIDKASQDAKPRSAPPMSAISEAAQVAVNAAPSMLETKVREDSQPGSDASAQAQEEHTSKVVAVEEAAKAAAQKVMAQTGEEDRPVTKSEAIAIATAITAVAKSTPVIPENIPKVFVNDGYPLDSEQMAAALTDGRVLVAAGAGSGKSTTLVSRVAYLIENKGVNPNRILVCSFNQEAAEELKKKTASKTNKGSQCRVGTMHSLFYNFILGSQKSGFAGFGSREEKAMLTGKNLIAPKKKGEKADSGAVDDRGRPIKKEQPTSPYVFSDVILACWQKCGTEGLKKLTGWTEPFEDADLPEQNKAQTLMSVWRGSNLKPDQVKAMLGGNPSKMEAQAWFWYHCYAGLKGDLPGWRPPCGSVPEVDGFMEKHRPNGERMGDLDDMLQVFHAILKRDPSVRKKIQAALDHVMVDEAQDMNLVQSEIFEMLTEHVTDGSDGKSFWLVGDARQAIYQFRGATPGLFTSRHGKEGWKTMPITTNYRCEPEIVDVANKLISHNDEVIKITARANPDKARGTGSVIYDRPEDEFAAAVKVIGNVRSEHDDKVSKYGDHAVLARTNKELDIYQQACMVAGIPYIRRKDSDFMSASESAAVLGYMNLGTSKDPKVLKTAFLNAFMKPNRGVFKVEELEEAYDKAAAMAAEDLDKPVDEVSPMDVLRLQGPMLARLAKKSYYDNLVAKNLQKMPRYQAEEKARAATRYRIEELLAHFKTFQGTVKDVQKFFASQPGTEEAFNHILDSISVEGNVYNPLTKVSEYKQISLRDQIHMDLALRGGEDTDDESGAEATEVELDDDGNPIPKEVIPFRGLGQIQFLQMLSAANNDDKAIGRDPTKIGGFMDKMRDYQQKSELLRIDVKKWREENEAKPAKDREKKPNAVTLSTVHSVKGLEWPNVTVTMPGNKFPAPLLGDKDFTAEEQEAHMEAERNLAYVALTRAAKNLQVIAPSFIGGKRAKPSQFIEEAGLRPGENVQRPASPDEEILPPTTDWSDLEPYAPDEGDVTEGITPAASPTKLAWEVAPEATPGAWDVPPSDVATTVDPKVWEVAL